LAALGHRTVKSLEGHLLVAARSLGDPNFHRSVVLMVKHTEQGALGLVLNRPSGIKIGQVWNQVSSSPCQVDQTLYTGGPIQGPLMAVHTSAAWAELEVLPGVHFTAAREMLEQLVASGEQAAADQARFFVGYSGWGPGQLEMELDAGAWLTTAASRRYVFELDDSWHDLARQIGNAQLLESLGIKHVPADPRLN
jgi:putative transcriptional regulator